MKASFNNIIANYDRTAFFFWLGITTNCQGLGELTLPFLRKVQYSVDLFRPWGSEKEMRDEEIMCKNEKNLQNNLLHCQINQIAICIIIKYVDPLCEVNVIVYIIK